ncbi:MAG: AAA-like domain-containing protein, partial [bacterium]
MKDKNKSPFNIGEKIYLNDFTYEEFSNFIKKSQMQLPQGIAENIFQWTGGNPRMTFDVCSEIEDIYRSENYITNVEIENVIEKLYLRHYDLAPIDHLKSLLQTDPLLRNAVINLQEGNFDAISSEVKKKLYLAGIINSDFDSKNLKIKNKIIESCLIELSNNIVLLIGSGFSSYLGLPDLDGLLQQVILGDDEVANRIRNTRNALEHHVTRGKPVFEELISQLWNYSNAAEMLQKDYTFRKEIGGYLPSSIDN